MGSGDRAGNFYITLESLVDSGAHYDADDRSFLKKLDSGTVVAPLAFKAGSYTDFRCVGVVAYRKRRKTK